MVKQAKGKKEDNLARTSFVLSIIASLILVAYFIAAFIAFANGDLLIWTYLAAVVAAAIALLGAVLSAATLTKKDSELSRKALYINLIVLAVIFVLLLFKII